MVTVRRMNQDGRTYYYLEHPVKVDGRPRMKSRFIGKEIPVDLERLKRDFLLEVEDSRWSPVFENIRERFDPYGRDRNSPQESGNEFIHRFVSNSLKISGSKITALELKRMMETGRKPQDRSVRDIKEARAYCGIFREVLGSGSEIKAETIIDWHWRMFRETSPVYAGRLRKLDGDGSESWPFGDFSGPMERLEALFQFHKETMTKANPVIAAGIFQALFWSLHPFDIGNGRIGRMMTNAILFRKGYPMLDIAYNERKRYTNALLRTRERKDEHEFSKWFCLKYSRKLSNFH